MKRLNSLLVVAGISLIVVLAAGVSLFRLQTTGSVLTAPSLKKGAVYFEGSKQVAVQQPFKLKVMIDTSNQSINAAGVRIFFDPSRLQVTDMSTIQSFCQFYPEKKFDNNQGIISLSCGAPHPGSKGVSQLVEFTFMPLAVGSTTLRMANNSKLLLSDGKGTNILNDFPQWEVQIATSL